MWSLIIIEKREGFSYYTTMDIDEIEMGDETIHVAAGNTEMWLQRSNCSMVNDQYIDYRGDGFEVYLECVPEGD